MELEKVNSQHFQPLEYYFNSSGSLATLGKTLLTNIFELSKSNSNNY